MADEGINMHKRLAMGGDESSTRAAGTGITQKYAKGGSVMNGSPAKSFAKMKKQSPMKNSPVFAVSIAIPVKKAAGRGR